MAVLTTWHAVNLVLNKEVDQGYQSREECSTEDLPPVDGSRVRRAQREASDGPRESRDQV